MNASKGINMALEEVTLAEILKPGFPIWASPGHAPSDNSSMLAESCVEFQLAR
jgi:hypothetical protein